VSPVAPGAVPAVVLEKIVVVLLVAAAGYLARHRGLLDAGTTRGISRVVVDVAFPALVLSQLPRTVDAASLATAWPAPLAGLVLVAGGCLLGRLLTRTPTGAFLVGLPNWIFLPLLIAEALYGPAGVRTVLLVDAGAQVALWTVGVATLSGGVMLRGLVNPGLGATGLGLVLALALPVSSWPLPLAVVGQALGLLGQLAVPLSLFAMGAQLFDAGGAPSGSQERGEPVDRGELVRVLVGRLVVVPALAVGALSLWGGALAAEVRTVLVVTAAMPVAISGSMFAQRFGGQVGLAARAVVLSTLLAALTVPTLLWLVG
jgi:predicted permease